MRILLLSMPDSFEHTPSFAIAMPNGALSSLAGNVDPQHEVAIADLVLVQDRVRETVEHLVNTFAPDVVGLSVMTFQRTTAQRLIAMLRAMRPGVHIVVGGYDPSLAIDVWTDPAVGVDFIVRGEGDLTLRELVRALDTNPARDAEGAARAFGGILGLSWRGPRGFEHNADRHASDLADVRPPKRDARVLSGYTFMGRGIDIIETSRGCTFDCSFCSIIEMRGRNFFRFPIERVLDDIRDAKAHGARAVFIVDDNITLDVHRFEALCRAIVDAGLNDIDYMVQGMTSAIANHGETLAPLMAQAGFRYVFLGIENILDEDLVFLRARAKNIQREHGHSVGNATMKAVDALHRHGMFIVGGLIVGSPNDTSASIEANLEFARRYIDWPYIQHPTPYPRTPMTKDFRDRGLIVSDDVDEYDGTTAVVRSEHVDAEEIEFMRWRAERWMKVRHFPKALVHDPLFVLRHAPRMFGHTFRGCTWKTILGLEDEREAFRRYKRIRRAEREFFPPVTAAVPQPRESSLCA